jgi:hypothetical protein
MAQLCIKNNMHSQAKLNVANNENRPQVPQAACVVAFYRLKTCINLPMWVFGRLD